jgi:hypothetical protein
LKIAACLGVKDEVELIRAAVEHLRSIGVDHIIALDANSTDGSTEILMRLSQEPWLELMPFDDTDPEGEVRLDADAMERARAAGCDWLLFLDADEFPLPRTGKLKDCMALMTADAVEIGRFNVPLTSAGLAMPRFGTSSDLTATLLFVPTEGRTSAQDRIRNDADAPWIQGIPAPKVMVRLAGTALIAEGGHGVVDAHGHSGIPAVATDLVIAHLPFSTEARFARKIENIRALVGRSGHLWGPDSAWHWRRWLDNIDQRGGVSAEFQRNRVTADEMAKMQRSGLIRTAAEMINRQ